MRLMRFACLGQAVLPVFNFFAVGDFPASGWHSSNDLPCAGVETGIGELEMSTEFRIPTQVVALLPCLLGGQSMLILGRYYGLISLTHITLQFPSLDSMRSPTHDHRGLENNRRSRPKTSLGQA